MNDLSGQSPPPTGKGTYMPQLDGIRAIAVIGVIAHHISQINPNASNLGAIATAGVHIFFVLTGFLTTTALLKLKKTIVEGKESSANGLRRFLLGRVLRIYPLYFAVVIVAIFANYGNSRELAPWLATNTLNIRMAAQGWYDADFAHFWFLSVVHQFYIVWPLLILALPSGLGWLTPLFALSVSVGSKGAYVLSGYQTMSGLGSYISTQANLDLLAIGSTLSFIYPTIKTRMASSNRSTCEAVAWMAIAYLVVLFTLKSHGLVPERLHIIFGNSLTGLGYVAIVASASLSAPYLWGHLLEFAPLQYLGRVSYGAYVYHPFIISQLRPFTDKGSLSIYTATFVICAGTLVISALSYRYLERPFLSLKEKPKTSSVHS